MPQLKQSITTSHWIATVYLVGTPAATAAGIWVYYGVCLMLDFLYGVHSNLISTHSCIMYYIELFEDALRSGNDMSVSSKLLLTSWCLGQHRERQKCVCSSLQLIYVYKLCQKPCQFQNKCRQFIFELKCCLGVTITIVTNEYLLCLSIYNLWYNPFSLSLLL